jgi:hypothetical protein
MKRALIAAAALLIASAMLSGCASHDPNVRDVTFATEHYPQYRVFTSACLTSDSLASFKDVSVNFGVFSGSGELTGTTGQPAGTNICTSPARAGGVLIEAEPQQDPDYEQSIKEQHQTIVQVTHIPCEPSVAPHCKHGDHWTEVILVPVRWVEPE